MTTPLYHASIAGLTGLAFTLGQSLYFAPVDDTRLYCVDDQAALTLTAEVEPAVAAFLAATIVEPRLLALAGRALVMIYILSEDDSILYLEGGWDAYNVEEIILRDLCQREVAEPTAVLLSDGATAFYVATGEIL